MSTFPAFDQLDVAAAAHALDAARLSVAASLRRGCPRGEFEAVQQLLQAIEAAQRVLQVHQRT